MTRAVLPGMVERKRGAVVNIATGGSELQAPYLAEYAASKKYVTQLALACYGEYAPGGWGGTLQDVVIWSADG